jgi:hypothetical protein
MDYYTYQIGLLVPRTFAKQETLRLKDSGGVPKNKIHIALNITVLP